MSLTLYADFKNRIKICVGGHFDQKWTGNHIIRLVQNFVFFCVETLHIFHFNFKNKNALLTLCNFSTAQTHLIGVVVDRGAPLTGTVRVHVASSVAKKVSEQEKHTKW